MLNKIAILVAAATLALILLEPTKHLYADLTYPSPLTEEERAVAWRKACGDFYHNDAWLHTEAYYLMCVEGH